MVPSAIPANANFFTFFTVTKINLHQPVYHLQKRLKAHVVVVTFLLGLLLVLFTKVQMR